MNLSELEIMGLIVAVELFLALAIIGFILNWIRRRDYRTLLELYKGQEEEMDALRERISKGNDPKQRKQDTKRLAELELASAESAKHISGLERDLSYFKRRTANLEVYQSLYKTLKTAVGSNSRFQKNLNQQIRSAPDSGMDIDGLLRESDNNLSSMMELVSEGNESSESPNETGEQADLDLDSLPDEFSSESGDDRQTGAGFNHHTIVIDDSSATHLRSALEEKQALVNELKQKLEEGDGQHLAELNQLESLLNTAYEESHALKTQLEKAKQRGAIEESLRTDLEMRKAKVKILQAEKDYLKQERDDLNEQCKKLTEDNQAQYRKMVLLAKTMAKGGVLKQDKDSYKVKKALADKEKEFDKLSQQYEVMRKEFVELESQYLKEVANKKKDGF